VTVAATARRTALALGLLVASILALVPPAEAAQGFRYGVAAGDVSSSSAILWARANRSGPVLLQIDTRRHLGPCGADGPFVRAKDSNDNTVQIRISRLRPETRYFFRFCRRGARSDLGTFKTAPRPNRAKTIRFALSGDQDALPSPGQSSPYWNRFQIWNLIRRQRNDFNVLLGDTIYSDTEVPGYGLGNVATTVPKKWAKYRINLAQAPWARARGSAAWYAHWDDHEFINDFSRFENEFPLGVGDVRIRGSVLYKRGVKAFRNYNPITYSGRNGIYRSFRWGKNLEIFFLDERSFRSQSADYQGTCDNPPGSGDPDLAPTAPQSTRNVFAIIAPQLSNPVPPACTQRINDPGRTMLGSRQLARFKAAVSRSTATFKVIFNEVPIQQFYALPYDRWEGYAAERTALINFLRSRVENVVFLTTDVHANLVNDVRLQTLESGGPVDSGITELTTGPVATATYSQEISDAVGNPNGGALVQSAFLKPPPPNGVGMRCAATDQFSYAEVTVTRNQLRVQLRDIANDRVKDTGDRDQAASAPACGPFVFPRQ
jgi:phosphodiesterase/alkaline phosphatase D-like protein